MKTRSERYPAATGLTLLIVDDDEDTRCVLADCVADRGMKVVLANRGEDALTLARSSAPDVILLDLRMPELDGFEVMRRLRAEPVTAGIPVIVLSAEALDRMESALQESGCAAAIKKPCTVEVLVEAIDRIALASCGRTSGSVVRATQGPASHVDVDTLPRSA